MDKKEDLKNLITTIDNCSKCNLCHVREKPTISRGDPRSPLMFISDFPRNADHNAGETLSGRAGKKFDALLTGAGIQPNQVYITSLLKCFAGKEQYFPNGDEPAQCFGYLLQQIKIVEPLVIGLLGLEAVAWVLARGTGEQIDNILPWLGKMYRRKEIYGDTRFMVFPHPKIFNKDKDDPLGEVYLRDLNIIKNYIVGRQKNTELPEVELIDLKKPVVHDKKEQLEAFKWKKPDSSN